MDGREAARREAREGERAGEEEARAEEETDGECWKTVEKLTKFRLTGCRIDSIDEEEEESIEEEEAAKEDEDRGPNENGKESIARGKYTDQFHAS